MLSAHLLKRGGTGGGIEKDREISPSGVSSLAAVGVVAPPPRIVARRDEAPGNQKGLFCFIYMAGKS